MLYGIALNGSTKAETLTSFKSFCTGKLGMSTDSVEKLQIVEIRFLGQKKTDNPPPTLVKLGTTQERNLILRQSHNLGKGESLDKFVPKRYLSTYKKLKKEAWKLRVFLDLATNLDFNGHLLTLKYKKKDDGGMKYDWTIHTEWAPAATDSVVPQTQKTAPATGLIPTPVLAGADNNLLLTGLKSSAGDEAIVASCKSIIEQNVPTGAEGIRIRVVGKAIVVQCKDKDLCTKVRQKCKDKKIMEQVLDWKLESEA